MTQHAPISPSGFYRTKKCPASVWASKDLPEIFSKHAADGTLVHEFASTALRMALTGKFYYAALNKLEEDWKIEMATSYVDFCIETFQKVSAVADKTPRFFIESGVGLTDLIYGTADFAIHFVKGNEDFLVLIDLKTGSGIKVQARKGEELNDQLALYAACFCKTHSIKPAKIFLYIFQPTFYEKGYDKTTANSSELVNFVEKEVKPVEKKVFRILKEDKASPSDYESGPHCRFCKALPRCKYAKKRFQEDALEGITDLDTLTPEKVKRLPITEIPIEKLLQVHLMKEELETWLASIDRYLMGECGKGNKKVTKHYKLVHSRAHSSWIDDEKRAAAGLIKAGIEKPYRKKLITITEARKQATKVTLVDKLIKKSKPKLQMVLLSDEREAVKLNHLDGLTEIDDGGDSKLANTANARRPTKKGKGKPGRKRKNASR